MLRTSEEEGIISAIRETYKIKYNESCVARDDDILRVTRRVWRRKNVSITTKLNWITEKLYPTEPVVEEVIDEPKRKHHWKRLETGDWIKID